MNLGVHRKILLTLRSKSRSPEVKGQQRFTVDIALILQDHISDMQLCIFMDSSSCYPVTFLAQNSLIIAAQKSTTNHWKGNWITTVLSIINDYYSDGLNIEKKRQKLNFGKKEKSDDSNICDRRAFQNAGISKLGHLVTNASVYDNMKKKIPQVQSVLIG